MSSIYQPSMFGTPRGGGFGMPAPRPGISGGKGSNPGAGMPGRPAPTLLGGTPAPRPMAPMPTAAPAPAPGAVTSMGSYTQPIAPPANPMSVLTGAATSTGAGQYTNPAAPVQPTASNTRGYAGPAPTAPTLNMNQIEALKRQQGNKMGSWVRAADGSMQFQPFDPTKQVGHTPEEGWSSGNIQPASPGTGPRQRRRYKQATGGGTMTSPGAKVPQSPAEARAMGQVAWYNTATNQMVNL